MSKTERLLLIVCMIIIGALTVFFGMRKIDYHVDEVWNFGLANHVGGTVPNIEYGKTYTGMGFFADFMEVNDGERFDYINVWKNQADDVHPPLYYVILHTVCSLFPNTYSMWFGIAVNLFWMVFIVIILYKLTLDISGNKFLSLGFVLAYGTTMAFQDTLLFLRMYTQFTFFAVATAYLIKCYWDKKLDRRFFILYSVLVILGLFTHYYYLIFIFAVSVAFGIHLIIDKRFLELRKCVTTAAIDGVIYFALWYHIAGHLFRGYRGQDAIKSAFSLKDIFSGMIKLLGVINKEAFGGTIVLFFVLFIVLLVRKKRRGELRYTYRIGLLLAGLFYIFMVGKIAPYTDLRYVMPAVFILYLIGFLSLIDFINIFIEDKKIIALITGLFLAINIFTYVTNGFYIPKDSYSDKKVQLLEDIEGKDCVVYIEDEWEILYFYQQLQKANSYVVINEIDDNTISEYGEDKVFATIGLHISALEDYNMTPIYESGTVCYYVKNN